LENCFIHNIHDYLKGVKDMAYISTYQEFQNFVKKYDIDSKLVDENFATLKIKKEEFTKETLVENIKKLVCKGYVEKQLGRFRIKDLLFYLETEYDGGDEYIGPTPLVIAIYTEQKCSDSKFQEDLDKFVDKIIDHYNGKRKLGFGDLLELIARYNIDLPEKEFDTFIRFYVFLSVEDIREDDDYVYITFGLWG
jgi:hypothetical protein